MMNRRSFLKTCGAGIAALSMPGCSLAMLSGGKNKPNIVYIMVDDLGYGDLSCYGQEKFTTPNIDRLAKEGMLFTQHYSGATVCAPSRCSLMTGYHGGRAYIRGNKEIQPEGQWPMPEDTVTVAKLLKKAGYRTGIFGKWGLGPPDSKSTPNDQGFDYFYGYNCQRQAHSFYPRHLWKNREKVILEGNLNGKQQSYSHDLIADETLEFIKRNKKRPFFLYVPFTIPHAAMQVPEDSLNQFKGKWPEVPHTSGGYAPQEAPRAAFAAMVTRMDKDVGRILDTLKDLGIDDNTIVMFTSDNGPHAEGGHDNKFFNSNGPLRGMKRDLYEGGIRVPFLALWPGRIEAGSETGHIAAFWDFLPTACELAGIDSPRDIDGISYLPAMLGKKQAKHEYMYWEHGQNIQAVRMGDWKAVHFAKNGKFELFNLKDDLGETDNVADKHPDISEKMKNIMKEAHVPSELFKMPFDPK